ncbi:MAG: cation:proton antiporter [Desulfotomaculales bacterium]
MWSDAALWVGLALAASLISTRLGISVALVEIGVGVIGGNFLGMEVTSWVNFLAGFGAIVLTFLAGAEVDPQVLRSKFKESVSIGFVSFLLPFLAAMAYTYYACGWDLRAAQIAGIALSTTSVAVVYAVMVETGLNRTELGKIILAACFVTDLGTVLALGILFAEFNLRMLVFAGVTGAVLAVLPALTRWYFKAFGNRVSEPEMKFLFLILFGLGALAAQARSEAVLPAYLVGLVLANVMADQRALLHRMRALAFSFLTPFYFLKAGFYVSLPAVVAGAGLIAILLLVKVAAKFIGVWPLTAAFRFGPRDGMYTTLLMSTGLTFGTISALYGLTNNYITQGQYTVLVTVVIASAVVPTLIAQAFFLPRAAEREEKVKAAKQAVEEA